MSGGIGTGSDSLSVTGHQLERAGSSPLSIPTTDGTSGLSLGNSELAVAVHDTYPVTGHFHYVLSRS